MRFRRLSLAPLMLAGAVFGPTAMPQTAFAQNTKALDASSLESVSGESDEVVTVAISPLDKLLPNITHVMRLVGAGAQSGMVNQMVNGNTNGLDRSRPIGAFVTLNETGTPVPVAALPVSSLDDFLGGLELFGESEDLGEGLWSFSVGPTTMFGKLQGDWLFVASSEDALDEVPEGATARLVKMVAKNDLLIEVNVQNIPDDLLDIFKAQMQNGFEQAMEAQSDEMDEEELEASRASGEAMIKGFEELIDGTEKFVVGIGIRPQSKTITIDGGTKFVEGSRFAKQLDKMKSLKSALSGVPVDGSMMTAQGIQSASPEDIAQMEATLATNLKAAYKSIDENAKDKASAERAKSYIDRFVKLMIESMKEGSIESAMNVTTEPNLNALVSLTVADGTKIEALASDIAQELAKEKVPAKLEINTGKYNGVNLHRATIPLPDDAQDEARKVFGDNINVAIGTAPKAVHISIGKDAEKSLKAAIDRVGAKPSSAPEFAKVRFGMVKLLNFMQSIESNPVVEAMLGSLTEGEDQIMVDSTLVDRGSVFRITVQEAILEAAANGAKAGQAANGGF